MNILIALSSDLPEILALQKLCFQESALRYNDRNIPPLTQTIDELKEESKNTLILKVQKNDVIIGSVRAYEKNGTCHIGRLIVHPAHQNKGIGSKLMTEMEKRFDTCQRIELFTGYKEKKNICLYQKLGYRIYKEEWLSETVKFVYLEKTI